MRGLGLWNFKHNKKLAKLLHLLTFEGIFLDYINIGQKSSKDSSILLYFGNFFALYLYA